MATIVIQDLDDNAELDRHAMRQIVGGRATLGPGLWQTGQKTLLDRRSIESESVLPPIGLGAGGLGSGEDL